MSNTKKLAILISIISLIIIGSIATIVVVLVNSNQVANSNVIVKYSASGVACELSATYYYDAAIGKRNMTVNGSKDTNAETVIKFNLGTSDGVLSPPEEDIKLTKDNSFAAFEYKFNNTSADVPMTVTFTINAEVMENITLGYYLSNIPLTTTEYTSVELLNETLENKAIAVGSYSVKYIYVFASIKNVSQDADMKMAVDFVLNRTASVGTVEASNTASTNGNKVYSVTGMYVGNSVTGSDLNNTLTNVHVLGWYNDPDCTQPATFPTVPTETSKFYAECLEGNISESNLIYDEESDSYIIDDKAVVIASVSTTSTKIGYTPITSGQTTLVIPDVYDGPSGRKPITEIQGIPDGYAPNTGEGKNMPALLKFNTIIKELYIGNNVKVLGNAFAWGATALEKLHIPNSVTEIKYGAFGGCTKLDNVVIPDSVDTLGTVVFVGCGGIKNLSIGKNITHLSNYSFQNLHSLTNLYFNCANATIGSASLGEAGKNTGFTLTIGKDVKVINNKMFGSSATASLPNIVAINSEENSSLQSIGNYAFGYLTNLKTVNLPEGLKEIKQGAFKSCTALLDINIPNSVTTIGNEAFYACSACESISLGNNLASIGSIAFSQCVKVNSIYFNIVNCPDFTSTDALNKVGSGVTDGLTITIGKDVKRVPSYFFGHPSDWSVRLNATSLVFENGSVCTAIGEGAFMNLRTLKTISLPSSLKTIGASAFRFTTVLTSVTIPNSVETVDEYAFDNTGITSLTVGTGITKLGNYAFATNLKLEGSVTIPTGVTVLPEHLFENCKKLEGVTLHNNITTIKNRAFNSCNAMTNFEIPSSVTVMEEYALFNCFGLTEITIPSGLTELAPSVLRGCTGLISVTIPNNIKTIGRLAFSGCQGLQSVHIGSGVKSIEDYAFNRCISLTEMTVDNANTIYTSKVNGEEYNAIFTKDGTKLVSGCNTTIIPFTVKTIGFAAFYRRAMTSIEIPSSVETIEAEAFAANEQLTSITIPSSVTYIGDSAFESCKALTSVTLTDGVEYIGKNAFLEIGLDWNTSVQATVTIVFNTTGNWTLTDPEGVNAAVELTAANIKTSTNAVTYLTTTYVAYVWERKDS